MLSLKKILEGGSDYQRLSWLEIPRSCYHSNPIFLNGSSAGQLRNIPFYLLDMEWLSTLGTFPKVGPPNLQGLNLRDLQERTKERRTSEKRKWLYLFWINDISC